MTDPAMRRAPSLPVLVGPSFWRPFHRVLLGGLLLGSLLAGCAPSSPSGQTTAEEVDAFFLPLIRATLERDADRAEEVTPQMMPEITPQVTPQMMPEITPDEIDAFFLPLLRAAPERAMRGG